jgi:hypothetical protein
MFGAWALWFSTFSLVDCCRGANLRIILMLVWVFSRTVIYLGGWINKQSMTLHPWGTSLTSGAWYTNTWKELACSSCANYSESSSRNIDWLGLLEWCDAMWCNLIISVVVEILACYFDRFWNRLKSVKIITILLIIDHYEITIDLEIYWNNR